MNNRNIIIVAALAVPVIGLALLSHSGTPERQPSPPRVAARAPNNQFKIPSVTEVRARLQQRVNELEKMSAAQYAEFRKTRAGMPASLDEAKKATKARLAQLQQLTQEQWETQTRQRMAQLQQRVNTQRKQPASGPRTALPATTAPATTQQRQAPSQQPAAR